MKAGISSYSLVRALESGEMTILDAIDWVAEQGGEHIEIVPAGFNLTENPELIPAMRSRAAERGIDLSNYAINAEFNVADDEAYEQEINRVMKQVDIAHELGIKLMRHDVATSKDPSIVNFNKDLERLASACRRIADYAAKYDSRRVWKITAPMYNPATV